MLQGKYKAQHRETFIKKLRKGEITEDFRQEREWKPSANGNNIVYKGLDVEVIKKPRKSKSKTKGKRRPKSAGTKVSKSKINRDISMSDYDAAKLSAAANRKTRGIDVYPGTFEQRMSSTPKQQPVMGAHLRQQTHLHERNDFTTFNAASSPVGSNREINPTA